MKIAVISDTHWQPSQPLPKVLQLVAEQQPDLLLRQAQEQQEKLKSGLALLLAQQQWTCDDILELCRDICPQWYEETP